MWKVLLVEDEVFVRESVREIIDWESMGFTVIGEAGNGAEALRLIRREPPDLVLADIIMPEMDGIELLRQTREAGIRAKFVMLTCMSEFEYIRQAMEYGASNYILKLSMNVKDLRETLGKIGAELEKESDGQRELARTDEATGRPAAEEQRTDESSQSSAGYGTRVSHPEVSKIIAYIHDHYDQDLSVKFLSHHVMMGENYVSALFKKKTGCTLIHYLHQVRVDKAIWYLRHTGLPVSEIGHKVGFANDNYFIKIFKRHTKQTPSLYRKGEGWRSGEGRDEWASEAGQAGSD
ncbi:response regulator [Paenibacillus daejeonensis]|uniref:response regulator n=1 Tax=Paenibacillus daejeonensis TaxID=135193 RepID=UPI00037F426E|nr:response regulator [Paenibacillus daejeonensis]